MQTIQEVMQRRGLSIISGSPVKQAQNHQPVTTYSASIANVESREIIDRLFLKLAAVYGNTWRNLYKSPDFLAFAKKEWLQALAGFEEKMLYQALSNFMEQHKFPPNIAEFLSYCKHMNKKTVFFKPEEVKKATPDVTETHLKKIKDILNIKSR